MPEFAHPFNVCKNDRLLTHEELVRAIRLMVAAEYEAIQLYQQLAESTDNQLAQKVLQDIADEEKVHAGEFLRLLHELDPSEMGFYEEGAREVEADFLGGGPGAEAEEESQTSQPPGGLGLGIGSLKEYFR
jgi:rubrerythrin